MEPRRRESTATSNADKTLTNNLVGLLAINASSFAHSHVCGVGRVGQVNQAVSALWSEDAPLALDVQTGDDPGGIRAVLIVAKDYLNPAVLCSIA